MPRNLTKLGLLVAENPEKAHKRLVSAFRLMGTRGDVAEHLGVSGMTVARWITKLEALGFRDPREVARETTETVRRPYKRVG